VCIAKISQIDAYSFTYLAQPWRIIHFLPVKGLSRESMCVTLNSVSQSSTVVDPDPASMDPHQFGKPEPDLLQNESRIRIHFKM
jgi:hypothetical protein